MEELSLGKYVHTSFLPLCDFSTLQNKMRERFTFAYVCDFFFIMEYNNSELHLFSHENPQ